MMYIKYNNDNIYPVNNIDEYRKLCIYLQARYQTPIDVYSLIPVTKEEYIAYLEQIVKEEAKDMKPKYTGKEMKCFDNSYAHNISNPNVRSSLAGNWKTEGVIAEIVTEPFECNIYWHVTGETYKHQMVVVKYKKEHHCVMFNEKFVI